MGFANGAKFDLDVSGIAGFFGGEESIAAMASVNLIRTRWLLGWYNSPGSYFVSKKYGIIANNRFWDGLFPGKDSIPAATLGLDGKHGPKFLGAISGTCIEMTGHLSHLLFSHCTDVDPLPATHPTVHEKKSTDGSHSSEDSDKLESEYLYSLTIVPRLKASTVSDSKTSTPARERSMEEYKTPMSIQGFLAALLTMGFSIAAAILVAVVWHDYFCCIAISIGILSNGLATLVYGSGSLYMRIPSTIPNAVPGDGILIRDNDMVILRGPESKIASITRGKYKLAYPDAPDYHRIGYVSVALFFQAFSQLILLPVATLKGQIFFLATFALSWIYNASLASVDREKLQFEALRKMLGLADARTYHRKTFMRWANIVAASAFCLRPIRTDAWLRQLIPNSTPVWDKWRECIIQSIEHEIKGRTPSFDLPTQGLDEWDNDDKIRLMNHLHDAKIGYEWYQSQLDLGLKDE
ncbi:hypothetical protein BDN70DRAFT_532785 [Pholiota conissans]|uniref:Uncharacterized protein n=1 Tax=Pholiota conissans TaxID=109636 RepID=A0A9P5ZEM6_9AGAR|nr:hypothetical protein BDN70DRAFT_532785 [Pholiota conissans]